MSEPETPITKVEMPTVAVFCSIVAWLSIGAGAFMVVIAIADSGFNKPDQTGLFASGMAVIFFSGVWFALARIVTLPAQIAHNTTATLREAQGRRLGATTPTVPPVQEEKK